VKKLYLTYKIKLLPFSQKLVE